MKTLLAIIIFLLLNINTFSQGGVKFEHLTFNEALAKAKIEKKLVFMDCYTVWCGPCRQMAEKILPQEKAGEYFNPKFISVKFDMEKGEGKELAKKFGIYSYPTFIIFCPDGSIQHKIVGGSDLNEFIARIEKGLNKNTALGDLEKKYEVGKINKKELIAYQAALIDANEKNKAKKTGEELDAILKDKDREKIEYWPILREKAYGSVDFKYVLNHIPTFYKNIGKEDVDHYLHTAFSQSIKNTLHHKAKEPIEILKQMRIELTDIPLENKMTLIHAIDLNQACLERNIEQAIAIAQEHATNEQGEIFQVISALNKIVATNATKEELKKLITLEDKLLSVSPGSETYVKDYFEKLKILASTGIYFRDLSYSDALNKAHELGRKLFIDCYTTWCNPCKQMAETVFQEEEVGNRLNRDFISIKIDMEKGDGPELMKTFGISAFPTFIILNSDGTLLHKFTGSCDKETFIKNIQENQNDNK